MLGNLHSDVPSPEAVSIEPASSMRRGIVDFKSSCIFTVDLKQHALKHHSNAVLCQHELGRCKTNLSKWLSAHLTEQSVSRSSKRMSVCDLRGCEQDDVEGLDHGRGKAQVPFLIQYVSQSTEDFLGSQQEG